MAPITKQIDIEDSGVVWSAIIGGAVASIGLTIILAPIGAAFGWAAMSPWHHIEMDRTFTIWGGIWLIIVQWLSSGFGGYLTGRLRTEWPAAHTHEVYFRDTAHGFLSWALATLAGAGFLLLATAATSTHVTSTTSNHDLSPTALFIYALSMFIGAFIAAAAGALGGAHRDVHYVSGRLSG